MARATGWSRDETTGKYTYVDSETGQLATSAMKPETVARSQTKYSPQAMFEQDPRTSTEEQPMTGAYRGRVSPGGAEYLEIPGLVEDAGREMDIKAEEDFNFGKTEIEKEYVQSAGRADILKAGGMMEQANTLHQNARMIQDAKMMKLQVKFDKFEMISKRLRQNNTLNAKETLMAKRQYYSANPVYAPKQMQAPKARPMEQVIRDMNTVSKARLTAQNDGNEPLGTLYNERLIELQDEMANNYGVEIYKKPEQEVDFSIFPPRSGRDIPAKWEMRPIGQQEQGVGQQAGWETMMTGEQTEPITATNPQTGEKIMSYDGGKTWQPQ